VGSEYDYDGSGHIWVKDKHLKTVEGSPNLREVDLSTLKNMADINPKG
jgi:hypothetical protein